METKYLEDTPAMVIAAVAEWQQELKKVNSKYSLTVDLNNINGGMSCQMAVWFKKQPVAEARVTIPQGQDALQDMAAQLRFMLNYLENHDTKLERVIQ